MSNVYHLATRKDKLVAASEWLAKIDRELDSTEQKGLQDWLSEDSQNSEALLEVAGLWDKLDSLSRLADLFPRQESLQSSHPTGSGFRPARPVLALAASALLVLGAGLWVALNGWNSEPQPTGSLDIANTSIFETSIGQVSTVQLSDGSILTLNTNTLVKADLSPGSRELALERGEVHVKVAHDRSRPFKVLIGNQYVEAVGTEFNLEITSDQRVELIVTEGKVRVGVQQASAVAALGPDPGQGSRVAAKSQDSLMLDAGKKTILGNSEDAIETLEPEEIEVKLSWRGGNLVFRGEPLVEAINEIERYTEVEFVIQDESLKQVKVAGLFKAGDVQGLLTTLKQNFDVDHYRVGDEQIILTNHAGIK